VVPALWCSQERAHRVRAGAVASHELGDASVGATAKSEAAGNRRLELMQQAILGAAGQQLQVTPDLPKKAARIGHNRGHRSIPPGQLAARPRGGPEMTKPGEPQHALDIAERARAAFDIRLFLVFWSRPS
jgi:hypothetical protein